MKKLSLSLLTSVLLCSTALAQGLGQPGSAYAPDPTGQSSAIQLNGNNTQTPGPLSGSSFAAVTDGVTPHGGPLAYIYNNQSAYLQHFRAGLARVAGNTGNLRVAMVGDSTTYGSYSNTTASLHRTNSFPSVLTKELNSLGLNAQTNNIVGFGASSQDNAGTNDSRFSIGSWFLATYTTAGGQLLQSTGTGTAAVFTPETLTNSFKIWYVKNSSSTAVIQATVTGQSAVNIPVNNASTVIASTTVTGNLGLNTLTLNYSSGSGNAYILAIEGLNTSTSAIEIMNAGWPTSTSTQWNDTSQAFSPIYMLGSLTPDVTFIDLGINDWNNSGSVATYTANLQAIINVAKATGDCVIVTPAPTAVSLTPAVNQISFVNAAVTVAAQNSCPVIDGFNRWGSYEIQNPLGLYTNTIHPNGTGYADFAAPFASFFAQNAQAGAFAAPSLNSLHVVGQVSAPGSSTGTLTNAPAATNPTYWLPVQVDGTWYVAPLWNHP